MNAPMPNGAFYEDLIDVLREQRDATQRIAFCLEQLVSPSDSVLHESYGIRDIVKALKAEGKK